MKPRHNNDEPFQLEAASESTQDTDRSDKYRDIRLMRLFAGPNVINTHNGHYICNTLTFKGADYSRELSYGWQTIRGTLTVPQRLVIAFMANAHSKGQRPTDQDIFDGIYKEPKHNTIPRVISNINEIFHATSRLPGRNSNFAERINMIERGKDGGYSFSSPFLPKEV